MSSNSLMFYCQSAKEGDLHCITQCGLCKPVSSVTINVTDYEISFLAEKEYPFVIHPNDPPILSSKEKDKVLEERKHFIKGFKKALQFRGTH